MRKFITLACVLGAVAVLLPLVAVVGGYHSVFVWSPKISYDDILMPISILVSFLVFITAWERSKKDSERKGVFDFLNKSYIHKECVVDITLFQDSSCVVREGNRILLRDLRHIFFRFRHTSNAKWVSASSVLRPYTLENQVAFNLADNLELLGEAIVAGFLPFREAVSFVGNNIIEDWLGSCGWVAALREDDKDKNKRVNGELIACMAFLSYYAHGRFEYLQRLQERYPKSFVSAKWEGSNLAMIAQQVKSRMLEILKQIGFVESALKGEICALEHKVNGITR